MTQMPDGYFDAMYAADPDPWGFETRWYESRKYAITMALLPQPRYERAFEPGCSIGVLTELLAERCTSVLSTDIAEAALERARARNLENVTFEHGSLRDGWPSGTFDLVVLSEMCYYFTADELPGLMAGAVSVLQDGGTLLAAHWRHEVADYPTDAEQVHRTLRETAGLTLVAEYRDNDVLIDMFRKV